MRGENVTGAHGDRPPHWYRIRVRGRLGETIRSAFPALQAQASGGDTVLTGPLPDRAALYGVLAQIETLGLELLGVRALGVAVAGRVRDPVTGSALGVVLRGARHAGGGV